MNSTFPVSSKTLIVLVMLIAIFNSASYPQTNTRINSKFNINKISTRIYNDGISDLDISGNSGFIYPRGTNKTASFCGGFLWAGKINGVINGGGSSHKSGLSPGKILSPGVAEKLISPSDRVFKVRKDYKTADLTEEAIDEIKSVDQIYNQYKNDWNNWPFEKGAPYEDVNKNGTYDPNVDIPGIIGADQTLWFVANDLDSNVTKLHSGSLPIGIEMQCTIWGYKFDGTYRSDALFKRYIIINKSKTEIKDMFFGIWADSDLGDAGDDLVGCDTLLNSIYTFNSKSFDATYNNFPPTFGYTLLQGPIVKGEVNDKAYYKGKIITGKKNLNMYAFGWIGKNALDIHDPPYGSKNFSQQLYNLMLGKINNGNDWKVPDRLGGGITRLPFAGDYVNKTGYIDGVEYTPGDRRMMMGIGSFNMAVGDTQEVVFMESAAGADGVLNYLESITQFKKNAAQARKDYPFENKYFQSNVAINVDHIDSERKIILDWGEDLASISEVEKPFSDYTFQGYNVYQFPDSSFNKRYAKVIATFDKDDGLNLFKPRQFSAFDPYGNNLKLINTHNNGVMRYFIFNTDAFTTKPIIDWREYYLGISFLHSKTEGNTNYLLESNIVKIRAIPNTTSTVAIPSISYGASIPITHHSGNSQEYLANALAVNPALFSTSDYELTFKIVSNQLTLNLKNLTTGKNIFTNEPKSKWKELPHFDGIYLALEKFNSPILLSERDVFRFNTKAPIQNPKVIDEQLRWINVFPNPFYGLSDGINNTNKFVTFTHLPQRATIKIFNVGGQIIKTLVKDSPSKTIIWNFSNDDNFLVPGGMYVALIELPDFGKTKTLKLIVVPSLTLPKYF